MSFEYIGMGIEPTAADILSLRVAPEHKENELAAMQARWWDYRVLHPTESTYLFAHHYREACVEWHRRYIDEASAREEAKFFTPEDIFFSRDLTSMWNARKAADLVGVPYPFVMEFASDRALTRGFSRMLRPNQFYGEEFELDLADAWALENERSLRTAVHPRFKASNFTGRPLQIEYRAWLISKVQQRVAPRYRLIARLLHTDDLKLDWLADHFTHAELEQALAYLALLLPAPTDSHD